MNKRMKKKELLDLLNTLKSSKREKDIKRILLV